MLTSAGISPRTAEWMVTMIKLSLDWEDPLEEETVTHSSILAWEIHGQRSFKGYNQWDRKELDTTE